MESISLTAVADEQLNLARQAHSGRAAQTINGGHDHFLRQTVIALVAEHELGEHESPGEATLQVLNGHVRLNVGGMKTDAKAGEYVAIPPKRHSLLAVEDSVVLLTVLADR
jgi:quercetin dioxygenase-like cupin family protein